MIRNLWHGQHRRGYLEPKKRASFPFTLSAASAPLGPTDFFALDDRLRGRWRRSLLADGFDCSSKGFSMLPLTDAAEVSDQVSRYVNKADARHAAAEMLNDQGELGRGESVGFFELLAYLCLDEKLAGPWFPLRKGEEVSWDESGLHVVNKATGEITWSSAMRGRQGYWRVLHSIEKVMKGRRVLNYSHRRRREDSVLDTLSNRFLNHVHAPTVPAMRTSPGRE